MLEFFAVRNKEGKWFRAKGYGGGYGDTWVDDLKKAKVYAKLGPARNRVSFFANAYPQYGIPVIVKLVVTESVVIDETERVSKQREAKQRRELKRQRADHERQVRWAQEELQKAEAKLKRLGEQAGVVQR